MKKVILSIYLLLFVTSLSKGQITILDAPVVNNTDSVFTEVGTIFYTYLGSNSINNHFARAVFKSEFLDDHIKNSNYLKGKNILATDLFAGAYIAVKPDSLWGSKNLGYRIGYGNRQFRSVRFTNDLYNLIFFGNKDFAGESANFSNTRFYMIDFQEIEFGLFKFFNDTKTNIRAYFGLNLLKGQQLQKLNVFEGEFFTAEDGSFVDLNTRFSYYSSDLSNKRYIDFNGIGLACDAYLSIEDIASKTTFTFSSKDLGYILWNNNSYFSKMDTKYHFEGAEINNILDIGQSNVQGLSQDSMLNVLNSKNDTMPFPLSLPERINIDIKKEWNCRFKSSRVGMNYIFDSGQPYPQFYFMQSISINSKFETVLMANYGGFSLFNAGLFIKYNSTKHISASIGSGDISGFILPSEAFARSIYGSFIYKF